MTLTHAKKALEKIQALATAGDHEAAHAAEDALHIAVLNEIAGPHTPAAAAIGANALAAVKAYASMLHTDSQKNGNAAEVAAFAEIVSFCDSLASDLGVLEAIAEAQIGAWLVAHPGHWLDEDKSAGQVRLSIGEDCGYNREVAQSCWRPTRAEALIALAKVLP